MYYVDIYNRVSCACLKDGMSARAAALYFNKDRMTIAKMLRHELSSGCRSSEEPFGQPLMLMLGLLMRSCAPIRP